MKVKLELTNEEFTSMQQLIDAGVRATGMQSVKMAAHFLSMFEQAAMVARAEQMVAQNNSQPAAPPAAAAEEGA